jgi:hypothetical protein
MEYYVRMPTNSCVRYNNSFRARSLKEYKVGNQLMYVPFGTNKKKALPEFTVKNMGLPEQIENAIVFESESETELEVTGENGTAAASDVANPVESGSLEAHGIDNFLFSQPQVSNDKGICGIQNTKGPNPTLHNAAAISTTALSNRFKDILRPGDHVAVFDFNNDDVWVYGGVIVSEGDALDTFKIKVGDDTRDIGKVSVVRDTRDIGKVSVVRAPEAKKPKPRRVTLVENTILAANKKKPPLVPEAATTTIEASAGTALCGKELVTIAPHQHISSSCSDCLSSTWACRYNSVNINTAILLQKIGLTGHVTKAEGNLCLYRALHELLPDKIPCIDHDEEGAKKILYDIVKNHLALQEEPILDSVSFDDGKKELLEALQWEGECRGLQAGYIMQALADHFQQSFNLYTVDLVKDALPCEQFTFLNPGGRCSKWLNIVCVPGVGQLLGSHNYDMHYIPAFKVHSAKVL